MILVYHIEPNKVERKRRDLKLRLAIVEHSLWPVRFPKNAAKCEITDYNTVYLTDGWEMKPEWVGRKSRRDIKGPRSNQIILLLR